MAPSDSPEGPGLELVPFVPRLLPAWLGETPDATYRQIPGTLVFADLSGFTAMSERLARRGKEGAEELTVHLDSLFSALLEDALHGGGTMLKFGGDALLILFWEHGHAPRACAAAYRMRATLRRVGHVVTSAGAVRLRMSVGIHTGDVDLFLAGREHRELIVTGPVATATEAMEAAAEAGDILVSPATAAALSRTCTGDAKGPGVLLRRPPTAGEGASPVSLSLEGFDPGRFVPPLLRRHLLAGGHDAEHRHATVAFLWFSGVDRLLAEDGPVVVGERLDALMVLVERHFAAHGVCLLGSDLYKDGGKLVAVAGAPDSHEDDEERMLRAVRSLPEEAPADLAIRVGVHRGPLYAGQIGPSFRRTYTVMGDTVNTAARVMAHAQPGEVLATAEVLRSSRTEFATVALAPFAAKGKARPLQAFRVGAPIGRRGAPDVLTLLGRGPELASLRRALDAARDGHGAVVEVAGEAGMGKSRLLVELVTGVIGSASASEVDVVQAVADSYETTSPYATIRPLLREALGLGAEADEDDLHALIKRVAPDLTESISLAGVPLGLYTAAPGASEDETGMAAQVHAALAELLSRIGRPTLAIVEDGQWLDAASAAFLEHLSTAATDVLPWLVCIACRPGVRELGGAVTRMDVAPLPADEARALARLEAPGRLLPAQLEVIVARAGGNPMFVRSLAAAVAADPSLEADDLPDTVERLFAAQIDRLQPAARRSLRTLAVLGREFEVDLAEVLLGEEVSADALGANGLDQFVEVADGLVRFRQVLHRDVAYSGLSYARRRALHGVVGERLERSAPDPDAIAARLSFHYHEAQRPEASWRWSRRAAEQAEAAFAYLDASALYRRALHAAARLEEGLEKAEVLQCWESLGRALRRADSYEEAAAAFASARPYATNRATTARLMQRQGDVDQVRGRATGAMRWYRRALRLLGDGALNEEESHTQMELELWVGYLRSERGDHRRAVAELSHALGHAEALGDRVRMGQALSSLMSSYAGLDVALACESGHRALAIFEELGDVGRQGQVRNGLGMIAYSSGDWDDAADAYRQARDLLERAGSTGDAAMVTMNLAEILSDQGRLAEARTAFEEVADVFAASGSWAVHFVRMNLGRLHARLGDYDTSDRLLADAGAALARIGVPHYAALAAAYRGEALVLRGDPAAALTMLDEVLRKADRAILSLVHRLRGLALLQSGDAAGARNALDTALTLAGDAGAPYEEALTREARAMWASATGKDQSPDLARSRTLLDRLGVIAIPTFPLGPER